MKLIPGKLYTNTSQSLYYKKYKRDLYMRGNITNDNIFLYVCSVKMRSNIENGTFLALLSKNDIIYIHNIWERYFLEVL